MRQSKEPTLKSRKSETQYKLIRMLFQNFVKIKQANQRTINGTIPKPESHLSTVTPRNCAKRQLEDGNSMQHKVKDVMKLIIIQVCQGIHHTDKYCVRKTYAYWKEYNTQTHTHTSCTSNMHMFNTMIPHRQCIM